MPSALRRAILVDEFAFNVHYRPLLQERFGDGIMAMTAGADRSYLLLQQGQGPVVAAAKLFPAQNELYLAYIEVAHDAKGQGYGQRLYKDLFAYAARNGVSSLVMSPYSAQGRAHLLPLEKRLAPRYARYIKVIHEYHC